MGKQTLQYKSSIKPYKAVKTFLLTLLRPLKLFSITEVNKRTTTRIFTVHSDTQHNMKTRITSNTNTIEYLDCRLDPEL